MQIPVRLSLETKQIQKEGPHEEKAVEDTHPNYEAEGNSRPNALAEPRWEEKRC